MKFEQIAMPYKELLKTNIFDKFLYYLIIIFTLQNITPNVTK